MSFADIFSAVKKGMLKDVQEFVEQNPEVVNAKDNDGWTPLHFAALGTSDIEILKYLISQGANINAKSKRTLKMSEVTPLHVAIIKRNIEFAEFFISAKANVNASSETAGTPLYTAAIMGRTDFAKSLELAKILVFAKADVNAVVNNGTLLHNATVGGSVEAVKILVYAGANVNAKDDKGNTPLHVAALLENIELIRFLVFAGADVNAKDNSGNTPLANIMPSKGEDKKAVKFLVYAGAKDVIKK
jgi:ankyrin repeat protein